MLYGTLEIAIIIIIIIIITACGRDGSIVFSIVAKFFLCQHDSSWTSALSLMTFCVNMYLDNF